MVKNLLMLPGPTNVEDEVNEAIINPMISHRGGEWHTLYNSIQELLKYLFQTKNTVYTLTSSGTGGVECTVSNIVKKGDKVLVPVNGEFSRRMAEIFEIYGAKVIKLDIPWGDWIDPEKVNSILEEDDGISILSFVYNETSTGVRNPAQKLTEIGRKHGKIVICDAISNLGGDELYMDKWGIDVVITGSQKAIACPPGLAFISLSERAWRKIEANTSPINYYWNLKKIKAFHQKSETPFTPAVSLFFGLDKALKIIKNEGIENRVKRHKICSKALIEGAKTLGLTLYPKKEEYASVTVNAFNVPEGLSDKYIKETMLNEHNIAIAGGFGLTKGKVIRIGTMGTVNKNQILKTINALEMTLKSKGINVSSGVAEKQAQKILEELK
ncbi:MAG: pyridoxal-phosphate-dependent aminotransferase family protein [Candidatus Odinarchaeia archaeon]